MNKNFNAKLIGAVISGTGLRAPKAPRVLIGSKLNGFLQGDLLDANAIDEYVTERIKQNDHDLENPVFDELRRLIEEEHQAMLDTINSRIAETIGSAPEVLDTLEELAAALGGDANFSVTVLEKIGNNEDEIAALKARVDRIGMSVTDDVLVLTI